jgi:hypothetical protein
MYQTHFTKEQMYKKLYIKKFEKKHKYKFPENRINTHLTLQTL